MSSALQAQLGVATSGEHWDVGDFVLWQSTDPEIILFVAKQPIVAKSSDSDRVQAVITQFQQWQSGTYRVTGGSALLTITARIEEQVGDFSQLQEQWRTFLHNQGAIESATLKFLPLPIQNYKLQVLLDPALGQAQTTDTAPSSEAAAVNVTLTEAGINQWSRGIKEKAAISGGIKVTYEYPRLMPEVSARVTVRGIRVFNGLSNTLQRGNDGTVYGSRTEIQTAWNDLVNQGDIEIKLSGKLPPELEPQRADLLKTFSDQAQQQLFDSLFVAIPAMDTFYALRWRKRTDAHDLSVELKYEAWNWLQGSMDIGLTQLLQKLDDRNLSVVYSEVSVPVSLVVEPDPMLSSVAISLTFSEGHAPTIEVFGKTGGTIQYVVTTAHPDTLVIHYTAKINFTPAQWSVIETSGEGTISTERNSAGTAQLDNPLKFSPGQWIRRHMIYLYVRDGNRIKRAPEIDPQDYLVLNTVYEIPSVLAPIKESSRITPIAPVEFKYLVLPNAPAGQAKISAFGLIGGHMVKSPLLALQSDEEAVFLLASKDGIQLVNKQVVLAEDDALAQRLLEAGARPIVTHSNPESIN